MLKCKICGGEIVPIFKGDMCQCDSCSDTFRTDQQPERLKSKCRGCGKEIMFIPTKTGKMMPIDLETYDGGTLFDASKHTSHFATCPQAKEFRKDKRYEPKNKA